MRRTPLPLAILIMSGCHFTVSRVDILDGSAVVEDLSLAADGATEDLSGESDDGPVDASLDAEPADLAMEVDVDLRPPADMTPPVCGTSCASCATSCCAESFGSGDHTVKCQVGCSCSVTSSAHDVTVDCPSVSSCNVTSHLAHDTTVDCEAGSTCSFDCTNAHNCSLACGAGSSCLIHCNTTFTCNLTGCATPPVDCGGNVHVCGRACP